MVWYCSSANGTRASPAAVTAAATNVRARARVSNGIVTTPASSCTIQLGGARNGPPRPPYLRLDRAELDRCCTRSAAGASYGRSSEETRGADKQHDGGHQIEYGQLDLREELDPQLAHDAHDERAHQRALEAAQPADHDHDERQDERVHAHPQNGRLARHDDGAAQARHQTAHRECLHVDAIDV